MKKKIFKVLNLHEFTRAFFREKHLSKNPCRLMGIDPAPWQGGIAISNEQLTDWSLHRSFYLRTGRSEVEHGIGLKMRKEPFTEGPVMMKDRKTIAGQFMKIVRTHNIKGILIGANDEAKFDGSDKKTDTFVDHFEFEESEEEEEEEEEKEEDKEDEVEEVLCARINERNSSNNAKKYVKQYGKHLGIDMEGIFRYTYLKKEMVDSASAGNDLEFYYQLIEASREKLFSDHFLELDKDDSEWSSLPFESFSGELGSKGPSKMRVPPSAHIPLRYNPWLGFYDTFLRKN